MALNKYGFDAAFGGARRDEEKSRAKERIYSLPRPLPPLGPEKSASGAVSTTTTARLTKAKASASSRSPTGPELDIWQYIYPENIEIVPLYLAAERPVLEARRYADDDR